MKSLKEVGSTDYQLIQKLNNLDEHFAWNTLLIRYRTAIRKCLLGFNLNAHECEEVESEIMLCLVKYFSKTDAKIQTSFRGFLARIIEHETSRFIRKKINYRELHALFDAQDIDMILIKNDQHTSIQLIEDDLLKKIELMNKVIELLKECIEPTTWKVYWDYTIMGERAVDVSKKYNLSVSAVYKYHKRVTKKLKEIRQNMKQDELKEN